jgi:hypothetical protein
MIGGLLLAACSSSTPTSTPPRAASLSVVGAGNTDCFGIGGCAMFFRIQPDPGNSVPAALDWRFEGGPDALRPPAGSPTSILSGRYSVWAHLNVQSDVIQNNQSPAILDVVSSCHEDVVIEPTVGDVVIRVTFRGLDPCVIEVSVTPS